MLHHLLYAMSVVDPLCMP
ncbi:hypothetical protein A2U01_0110860 [Trifolium medium]|uniref:Uncharacterized protein n=1 Tax=Trifolium medium TaxID=97028 RepID=A0A392VRF1_9FABA|nr:hypothetical protein [Trifolium medium]